MLVGEYASQLEKIRSGAFRRISTACDRTGRG